MKDADGRLVAVVTLLEDVTHLSEVSRLKSEFIAAASHELRTPLTSVQMGIHLLLESTAGTLDERQREVLLREQMAAIQRQLGEGEAGRAEEIAELGEAITKASMLKEVEEHARKELRRLQRFRSRI